MLIGQERLRKELDAIKYEINKGKNFNLIFSGPSGYGKTSFALNFLNRICPGSYYISGPPLFKFHTGKRFNFLDEIHRLKEPEFLYSYLDSGNYVTLFTTNEIGLLEEALVNRCIPLYLEPYTREEIELLIKSIINLPQDQIDFLLEISSLNPRIVKVTLNRLVNLFGYYGKPNSVDELANICHDILNINSGGLTKSMQVYLDYLKRCGGQASLDLIKNGTRLDKGEIMRDIEPVLIYKGLIRITSKGRIMV
jgi:Holliday junction resolvasome RuvABC ATP-dependent DNA helicase subunit